MLHPPYPIPERILIFGDPGSGKTTSYLNIAKFAQITSSPARFHIFDTDEAIHRMLTGYPNLTNIVPHPTYEWTDFTNGLTEIKRSITPTDWIIVDFISTAWSAVQEYFADQVFHQDLGNYFLQARKMMKDNSSSLGALGGWTDWPVINKLYNQWINQLLFRNARYNVLAVAMSKKLSSDAKPLEDEDTRQMFLGIGSMPTGQKRLGFQFHTVIYSQLSPTPRNPRAEMRRTITTLKDRERPLQRGLVVNNFALDYLKGVGGWQL